MEPLFDEIFENEWYIVRYSGETPEISYNSSLYFLTRAEDGPKVSLSTTQIAELKKAAMERYKEIVLRDLYHENHRDSTYRGVQRSIYNFDRLCKFCGRQDLCPEEVRKEAAALLSLFLQTELERLVKGDGKTIINCSFKDLQAFAAKLGTDFTKEHEELATYCPMPE